MVTKPARMGGAIWLYKQPFHHRILRFVLLQRRHRSSLIYETRSLLAVDQSLQRIKTFSADFPADSPLSSHFRACSWCSLTVPCRQPATWCNLVTKTTAQAIGRSMASLVVDADGDEGCGQDPLSGLSGLPHWPVWTRCGRVGRALHCGREVVPGNATLPAKALQLCSWLESPQICADSPAR